jgi:hypothetical protein
MKTTTIQPNQTYLDAAIGACGTLEAAMALMLANNTSITNQPDIGTVLQVPAALPIDNGTLQYLQRNAIVLGTRG